MDHYSILDSSPSRAGLETVLTESEAKESASLRAVSPEPLRFPGDDGGRSLNHMAQRDLDAALQLLAERAQYITGASGAAIALRRGEHMICRASSGESAPKLGSHLQVDSGLSGESVRTRQMLCCDDAQNDPRVNWESCRALRIVSVVVMPLVREQQVNGIFELLSERAHAFEERDFAALERLAEMIQTALDHAEATKLVENELISAPSAAAPGSGQAAYKSKPESDPEPEPAVEKEAVVKPAAEGVAMPQSASAANEPDHAASEEEPAVDSVAVLVSERGNIGTCQACGFPISEGRKLCLDCEADQIPELVPAAAAVVNDIPEFLTVPESKSWLQSHLYVVVTILMVAATVILILWRSL
jgi:putative methionine-R-sulfoxide reductase with GAF domain